MDTTDRHIEEYDGDYGRTRETDGQGEGDCRLPQFLHKRLKLRRTENRTFLTQTYRRKRARARARVCVCVYGGGGGRGSGPIRVFSSPYINILPNRKNALGGRVAPGAG